MSKINRKYLFVPLLLLKGIASFVHLFTKNYYFLVVLRFFIGISEVFCSSYFVLNMEQKIRKH